MKNILLLFLPLIIFSQASLNMVQIGNLNYDQGLNDIWGYTDLNGTEYALVGCENGLSYVDISDPSNPNEVFFISGSNSIWRDIKTWDHYAYITTEAADGLLIVDLDDLSGQTYEFWTDEFLRAHNIYIDENGYAYILGSQDGPADGAIILDLNEDPMNPSLAGFFDSYYLHDGMARGDTLWGSAIYEGLLVAIDVSDKSNPVIIGSTQTSCSFTHNAWVSDDGNYVFTTDEQQDCNIGAYDVSNVSDIQQTDFIQSWNNENSPVIPHNTHVRGDYLFTSYYTSGVTVVDASDPYNLIEIAYYDTSPNYDGGSFDGCWGTYPFLPSGLILASDRETGLHILEMVEPIYGCMDENACNYDSSATDDDDSCEYDCYNQNCSYEMEDCIIDTSNLSFIYNEDSSFDEESNTHLLLPAYLNNYYHSNIQVRIPTDTSFVYDLGSGPQLFENVNIISIGINSIEGLPDGLYYQSDDETVSGGEFACFSILGVPIESGSFTFTIVVDVVATYETGSVFIGPIELTDSEILANYYTINVEECNINDVAEIVLWEEDFADDMPENVIVDDVNGYGDWIWSTESTQGQWGTNAGLINSPTVDNGFMIIDADWFNSYPNNGTYEGEVGLNEINASFTIGPIDLSESETNALVLQFYSYYRICCSSPGNGANDLNVYISTDGGNTFEDLNYIEGDIYEANVGKQTLSQIPLEEFSPNVENVYFKFEWVGTHYFWMIDDISVIQQPAYDLKMLSSWLTMANPSNIEYYSIPENQMPNEMMFGGEIYNYGYNDEFDVQLDGIINGTNLMADVTYDLIESDSTKYIETDLFDISSLSAGTYTFTTTVESNGDDALPSDNSLSREFVVSENEYKIDGIYDTYDYMGTGWPGGAEQADGMRFANFFDIKEATTLSSVRIGLYLNAFDTSLGNFETTSGGEVIFYLCDTTGIWDPNVATLDVDLGGVLWESDYVMVQDWMVDDGFVSVEVPDIPLDPNAYYLVVELWSNGLENDIIIYDDTSVAQPWWASLYFSTEDQTWYSNPNAMAIHMGLNGLNYANINEETMLDGIDVFPNPTNDLLNITSNKLLTGNTVISMYNILGENVKNWNLNHLGLQTSLNIEEFPSGNYILKISNNEKTFHEKIIKE